MLLLCLALWPHLTDHLIQKYVTNPKLTVKETLTLPIGKS